MKCPKCEYLGFEEVDRCRNCGYEFALAHSAPPDELPLRDREAAPIRPLEELSFLAGTGPGLPATPQDLPLFGPPIPDDEPLITRVSPPRTPLSVRRATPEVPRLRAESRAQSLDLAFDGDPAPVPPPRPDRVIAVLSGPPAGHADAAPRRAAGLAARFVAVVIDLSILALVDALVIYFTMQLCGLTLADFGLLPKRPLFAFLLVQNGGYLVAFTAGGQTLGKMVTGIRVVNADESQPLDLSRAILRTLLWLVLAIPAGLGFLTALVTSDHRGLHDRLAGTRVVRAAA
ncbi:MAG: RDD family protein [Acidobacteriota bacterium]